MCDINENTYTHTDCYGLPYVGVVQYTGSSSSRRRVSWSRKEFGESERLLTLTPPWLREASSPDKAPDSSLWKQQRRWGWAHQSQRWFFNSFSSFHQWSACLPGCVWHRGWRGDVKVLEGWALGGGSWRCGWTATWASGWLQAWK